MLRLCSVKICGINLCTYHHVPVEFSIMSHTHTSINRYDAAIMTGVALIWPLVLSVRERSLKSLSSCCYENITSNAQITSITHLYHSNTNTQTQVLASVIRSYNAHSPAASQSARDESHREAFVNAFESLDKADGSSKGSVNKNLVLEMLQELFHREALHESASHMKSRKRYQIPRFDLRFVMLEELRRLGMNTNQTYLDVSLFMQLLSSPENFYLGTEKLKLSQSKLHRPRIKNLTIERWYPNLMPKADRNFIQEIVSPRCVSPFQPNKSLNWYQCGVRMWITHDEASYNGWDMHWSQSVWEPVIGIFLFLNVVVPLIVGMFYISLTQLKCLSHLTQMPLSSNSMKHSHTHTRHRRMAG